MVCYTRERMKKYETFLKYLKRFVLYPFVALVVLFGISLAVVNIITRPSNNRNWSNDQKILPFAETNHNLILIHNIRNFKYSSTASYTEDYYDKVFDINTIKRAWFVVEPFSKIPGPAHTFISFEFEDNQFVSISVEIRKEKGESFNPLKGLFNQYELMYVIADERDVIKLRSNYRHDLVYVYPIRATKEKAGALFLNMIARANVLKENTEFYNTITSNCTTKLVNHINAISPGRVPSFSIQAILPKFSDALAYKLGLLDTNLTLAQARERFLVNDKAKKYASDENFSVKIRN